MITVIIPTYNRVENLKTVIERCIKSYNGSVFAFEIHDSGDDSDLADYVEAISNVKIKYVKYDNSIEVDNKVIHAITECKTEFFYLYGDSVIVDFNKLEKSLIEGKYNEFDCINVEPERRKTRYKMQDAASEVLLSYTDIKEYALKFYSHMTFWGALIVKKDIFDLAFKNKVMDKYLEDKLSWWISALILESALIKGNCTFGTIFASSFELLPKKKSWSNQYFELTFRIFNKDILLLPEFYDDIKKLLIKSYRDDYLATSEYFLLLRQEGILTYKNIKLHEDEIRILPGYFSKMLLIGLVPRKIIWLYRGIKHKINCLIKR